MKYGVICYAVHNKSVATYEWFDDIDNAIQFVHDAAEWCYQNEANIEGDDNVESDVIVHYARVSSCNGKREWTWNIIYYR